VELYVKNKTNRIVFILCHSSENIIFLKDLFNTDTVLLQLHLGILIHSFSPLIARRVILILIFQSLLEIQVLTHRVRSIG